MNEQMAISGEDRVLRVATTTEMQKTTMFLKSEGCIKVERSSSLKDHNMCQKKYRRNTLLFWRGCVRTFDIAKRQYSNANGTSQATRMQHFAIVMASDFGLRNGN